MEPTPKPLNHPCFNYCASKNSARIHLPVAPDCNIQCNYCNRKYDCVNESRPGVTSKILSPHEARDKYIEVKEKIKNISIVGFAGPGDPLANFDNVKETVELIKKIDSKVDFCLSTNGLMLPEHAEEMVKLGISYITITINTFKKETGSKIYDYVNYEGNTYRGEEAADILINQQLKGIELLKDKNVLLKTNSLYLKGINDNEITGIAQNLSQKQIYIMNLKNLIPSSGSKFEKMEPASNSEINNTRKNCHKYVKQMYHCRQCRSDSIGLLAKDRFKEFYQDT